MNRFYTVAEDAIVHRFMAGELTGAEASALLGRRVHNQPGETT